MVQYIQCGSYPPGGVVWGCGLVQQGLYTVNCSEAVSERHKLFHAHRTQHKLQGDVLISCRPPKTYTWVGEIPSNGHNAHAHTLAMAGKCAEKGVSPGEFFYSRLLPVYTCTRSSQKVITYYVLYWIDCTGL